MNFDDLQLQEEHFDWDGERYTLFEPSGKAGTEYENFIADCTRLGPDGNPTSVKDLATREPFLLSRCLKRNCPDTPQKHNKPVHMDTIGSWPYRVQKRLFKRVCEMGEMEEGTLASLIKQRDELDKRIEKLQEASGAKNG